MSEPIEYAQDYVLRPQADTTFMAVTSANTTITSGINVPIPVGNVMAMVTWEGAGRMEICYLPTGAHESSRVIAEIPTGIRYKPRRTLLTLPVDSSTAVLRLRVPIGADMDCRAGVKIITT